MGQHFYARGKILLSGEYVILDGALGIGLPTRLGQHLYLYDAPNRYQLHWQSLNANGEIWHDLFFDRDNLNFIDGNDPKAGKRLENILKVAFMMSANPPDLRGIGVRTELEFDKSWGLGTSSTLLYNLAQWFGIDPYELANRTFGGSGYDLACAGAPGPIMYQRRGQRGHFVDIPFHPGFLDNLYLIYLGLKKNSREGISKYRGERNHKPVQEISRLSLSLLNANDLNTFSALLNQHEALISQALGSPRVQDSLFPDIPGVVKSLGAWGGDFVLCATPKTRVEIEDYFSQKGYKIIFPFSELVLLDSN